MKTVYGSMVAAAALALTTAASGSVQADLANSRQHATGAPPDVCGR